MIKSQNAFIFTAVGSSANMALYTAAVLIPKKLYTRLPDPNSKIAICMAADLKPK